ncbi:Wzz/FepE/Etk N-terminal domain-containing protein [Roseivivax isoporae]|uniref:Polysaccharide chain length determinant N-terminal domain-containing protein n=1 Tax=Roseivivax isoporae LMG 25204 TaxID=1449351 RepID=X7F4N6_9RHOB|nr:Wzz/FepE/Etk N-terminal domain-containing protein [Roseivivax isoporae]ETX27785.1 hypothetical protein RISW2_11330 [Roseivivax isoporae LMG 25204]
MNQFQSFDEVLAAVRRRFWLILGLTLLGCLLSVQVALRQDPLYEATAVVQIEDARVPDPFAATTPAAPEPDAGRRVRLIEQRLMARDNLLGIMDAYALFPEEESVVERISALREAVTLEEIRGNAEPWQTGIAPSGLRISVRLDDAGKAAAVANELMTSVIEQARERSLTRAQATFDFFDAEVARVSEDIAAAEAAIAEFKRANADALPGGLAALRDQLNTYRQSALSLEQEIIALRNNSARIREGDLARQVALYEDQQALIRARIAAIEADLARAPDVERDLGALERDLTQLQERYAVITRRKADAEMGQILQDREQADRFEVLETALVPETSISRSKKKVALAGGVASVLLAVGVAFLAEVMNPAIRTAAQLERQLGITPVAAIPPVRSRRGNGRRKLIWLGGLAGLALLGWAAFRTFGGALLDAGIFDRLLPRRVES